MVQYLSLWTKTTLQMLRSYGKFRTLFRKNQHSLVTFTQQENNAMQLYGRGIDIPKSFNWLTRVTVLRTSASLHHQNPNLKTLKQNQIRQLGIKYTQNQTLINTHTHIMNLQSITKIKNPKPHIHNTQTNQKGH